jgi:hypothetical protein
MMAVAEKTGALAPEQYGSRKKHKAIDLAVNKALTFDILRQLKRLEPSVQMMQSHVMI